MDDVVSFSIQQMFKPVIELPTEDEMRYWDEHYTEIPKEVRDMHMTKAENDLNALKMDETFMNAYNRLPVDMQSCMSIMIVAKVDLEYIGMNSVEKLGA